ncbi:uncharacterized protein C1orf158 homolog [Clupea harengus]|uniref:Uncharacterized protein C1orf158 homolog n=1 Tax=Clupea harengus TaxID=7950 RepID=A0A8M1KPL4_CLUHA|nr:uncharacterized protein C1orf158 homolog [Clupea harengus]
MWRKEKSYDKWTQPGWRIEQKYANRVLIGNWVENRLQFTRECRTPNSTNRLDFRPQWDYQPDTFVQRTALRRGEGLPTRLLLGHHGTPTSHFLVTQYDEMYRWRGDSTMPKLRSDHVAKVPPTNFGLVEAKKRQWSEESSSLSSYRSAYLPPPLSALCHPRHAGLPSGQSHGAQRPLQPPQLIQLPQLPGTGGQPALVQTSA